MHSNHFIELAKSRYSCRSYEARPVEQEKLTLILEAGRVAPSAVNFQPWHFYVIREKHDLERFYEAYHREWFRTAPCVIVVCADHSRSWKRKDDGKDHADVDIAIATDHMTLQAAELGLATCWICNFNVEKTRELLKLPGHREPVVILPLGYPLDRADPERHRDKRKPLSEIVSYGL
ncbi:MAG: nitroreductase family protein [Bacteroidales bacterium]|nr:nitroreductase family protein [Bacteroidales bacterium]